MNTATTALDEHPCVRLVRNVALRRALWQRSEWATRPVGASVHEWIESLSPPLAESRAREAAFYGSDPGAQALTAEIAATADTLQSDEAWQALMRGLDEPQQHLLALCIAAESDPSLRRLYGYLLDEAGPMHASPWLAELLFAWPPAVVIGPDAQLFRARLAAPLPGQSWSKTAGWTADPTLLGFLNSELIIPADIAGAIKLKAAPGAEWPVLFPEARLQALAFLQNVAHQPATAYEIVIAGPAGSGRRTLAGQLAALIGRETLQIDVPSLRLEQEDEAAARIAKAARTAFLAGAVPVWIGAEHLPGWAWDAMTPGNGVRMLLTQGPAIAPRAGVVRQTVKTGTLPYDERVGLWHKLTATTPPAPVREWALTVGDLVASAQIAPLGEQAVVDLCRSRMGHDDDDLLSPLNCPFSWEDLVVQGYVEQHLREFESQVRLRHAVFEEWGFGRQRALGQGISALFCGPSGVGKTMAAQVIAKSLGLELLRVDFASLINKYVGETEKRIRQVFRRCQRANVMLFIDECDAVFSHRVQTRDAQDRFANIEVDYLLQCMEQFDGVAVLATNRKGEIDSAFLRRIRFIVDFMPPTQAERLRLWKLALPETSPGGEPLLDVIDFQVLSRKLNLTGAEIKNVAVGAAFLARAEATRIGVRHIVAAARREVAKQGTVVRPGEWEGF